MKHEFPTGPPGPPKTSGAQTIRLALLFTLFMLVIAFVLWRYGLVNEPARSAELWIATEQTQAAVGRPVTLSARVTGRGNKPVAGVKLGFWRDQERLGRSQTDEKGYASVTATFDRPGDYQIAVTPDPTEKRDWQIANRASIPVTVEKPQ